MVDAKQVKDALEMAILDEVTDSDDISSDELIDVRNRFAKLMNQLIDDASSEEEDEESDEDEDVDTE